MENDRFFVKSLKLENFRCFEKVELGPFDPHFNLLVGTNGAGKSSVLLALADIFRPLAALGGILNSDRILNSRDNRAGPVLYQNLPQSTARYPWKLSAEFEWAADAFEVKDQFEPQPAFERQPKLSRMNTVGSSEIIPGGFQSGMFASRSELIVLYGVERRFDNKHREDDFVVQNPKSAAYLNWLDAGQSSKTLQEWMRDQTIVDLQLARLRDGSFVDTPELSGPSRTSPSPLSIVRDAIREAVEGAREIEYDGQRKDIVVRLADGRVLEFAGMSDGQRALIGMVADIARRACVLRGDVLDFDVLNYTTGLALIDELDLHLHPKWQRHIVRALKRVFPKIQFFATTHSPQVIGEARPEEIVLLTPQGQKRPIGSYGMDSNWVLECVMEVEDRDPAIARRIKDIFDAIDDDRIEEAKGMIAALRADIGNAPDIVGAESYIWRIEHQGDEAAE
ncbi:AAA family ATPase [Roseiarcus sp.]|uniref:AAA family ATPase n=1 Tax=Roseiarcus sp. TaxID=1969460 RepID=UPI003F943C5B